MLIIMNSEALKARSIELAERAYRQKDRTRDDSVKSRLDDAADELIHIENPNRFFSAQSKLEKNGEWTEEQRALAHEINVADQIIRNINAMKSNDAIRTLESWSEKYIASYNPEIKQTGQTIYSALRDLITQEAPSTKKDSLNYLIALIESILAHIQLEVTNDTINENVILLRSMRDAFLSVRELLFDETELLDEDKKEDQQVDRVQLARESLKEIYKHIQPIKLPD